jgi:hypothetical protein
MALIKQEVRLATSAIALLVVCLASIHCRTTLHDDVKLVASKASMAMATIDAVLDAIRQLRLPAAFR